MDAFFVQVLNSVQYGLLLFLVASGFTLVFGIMGIINLAHGSFYMVGAYLAYVITVSVGDFLWAFVLGVPLCFAFGFVLEWLLFRHLYRRDHLDQVLLTFGLILIFEEVRSILVGDDIHGVAVPQWLSGSIPLNDTLSYPVYRLFVSAVCLVLALALYLLIHRTRLGMKIRAGNHDQSMVQALGINIHLLYRLVFALGFTLAALAGMLAVPIVSVGPGMGNSVLIISFVVVVIGGIGSVWGALLGAILVGFADTFGTVLLPGFSGVVVYVVMALVLLRWPNGLLTLFELFQQRISIRSRFDRTISSPAPFHTPATRSRSAPAVEAQTS